MLLKEVSQSNTALGGEVKLTIVTDALDNEVELIFRKLWHSIFSFEKRFSRFIPNSELSIFNRSAGLKSFVSPEFKALLETSKHHGQLTDGIYNPFILPALQRAGYTKSALVGYEHDTQDDHTNKKVVNVKFLEVNEDSATIPYGTALDMGGIGKGYLADQLGQVLKDEPVFGYWLSLGGDIVTMGKDENGKKITVNIQDASRLGYSIDQIVHCPTNHSAIATSGTFRRKLQESSGGWHHIIDPSTGESAKTDVLLATVCADSATLADVLASCAIILGSEKALTFLKKLGAKAVLLQCMDQDGDYFTVQFGARIKKSNVQAEQLVAHHA